MTSEKVAVVTGANKGLGYAIVKGLCEKFQGTVYLTARDVNRGKTAVDELKKLGLNPEFHQLDVTDQESVNQFKEHISKTYGGIDVLVNNAGIILMQHTPGRYGEGAEQVIETNYFSLLRVCQSLFPILRTNARVVNLSSSLGHLSKIPSAELRAKFSDPNLNIPELNKLMNNFVKDMKENRNVESWGTVEFKDYNVSKVGVSALTFIQQKEFDREVPYRNVSVNCVHPGYVGTDINNHTGPMSVEQGVKAPLFLALDAKDVKGKLVWFDNSIVDWTAPTAPNFC